MSYIGVDCGGTNLEFGIAESPAALVRRGSLRTPDTAEAIPGAILAAVAGDLRDAAAIGIGVAGLVDRRTGVLRWMPHRDGTDIAIGRLVAAETGLPVLVDNDANLAALAEARLGAGRGHRMVLMVALGTGIGAGLVVDGRVERGRGFLGEVGHMVVDRAGPPCPCGRRGCWETFASGTVLDSLAIRLAAEDPGGKVGRTAAGVRPDGRHLVAAATAGDPMARAVVESVGEWLGVGLANLVVALDPDVIVVGGAVSAAGEMLLAPARRSLLEHLSGGEHRPETPVLAGSFGADAGLVGAVVMAEEAR